MSYLRKLRYTVKPEKSFPVLRNCAGCGCKTTFINTNNFRVNANGNKIDVWLIYQCEKCKHTANFTIYERQKPDSIDKKEYRKFLANDEELAYQYGTDHHFFARNKAVVDWSEVKYCLESEDAVPLSEESIVQKGNVIEIHNKYMLKIRMDKLVAEILHFTRSKIKELEKQNVLIMNEDKSEHKMFVLIEESINSYMET